MKKAHSLFVFILVFLTNSFAQNTNLDSIEPLVNELWFSSSVFKSARAIKKIEKLNPDFDNLKEAIENKITFSENVKKGFVEWEYKLDSLEYYCILFVPTNYNFTRKYPVTFILHGAIANLNPRSVNTHITSKSYNTDSLDKIIVYPASWMFSLWWEDNQVKNIAYILNRLKQTYNIDENNIDLAGISDGGTGCYYQANKNSTPWSSIRPYIGNPIIAAEFGKQTLYLKNFSNKPFFIVNTDRDHLYPARKITPYIDQIKRNGASISYYIMEGYEHNLKWQPLLEDTLKKFIEKNSRVSYPASLFWQTNNPKISGRNHWLIIEKLQSEIYDGPINTLDEVLTPFGPDKNKASGYVSLKTNGNIIEAETKNIKQFTLLLSPNQFDFNKPITVYVNNTIVFDGIIKKDTKVLLKWLAKDLDRTMLFGNELKIKL